MTTPLFFSTTVKSLRPTQRALWKSYEVVCERQARRTTFLRITDPELEGARIQLKHSQEVTIEVGS